MSARDLDHGFVNVNLSNVLNSIIFKQFFCKQAIASAENKHVTRHRAGKHDRHVRKPFMVYLINV